MDDNVDCMMNMSIEITSNNKMIKNYIRPITLRFKDEEMETKVNKQKNTDDLIYVLRKILNIFYIAV